MNKVLVICGPTAVGKTALALDLATKVSGDILVADSRQVYKGMDIVTGKDIPRKSKFQMSKSKLGYWKTEEGLKIWMTDLVEPNEEFSVSLWNRAAKSVIEYLHKEGKLPIITAGTGFYIDSLLGRIQTINILPNKSLRAKLKEKTADELYEILASVNAIRAASMNQSDKNNPRRLLRAIEVALAGHRNRQRKMANAYEFLFLGLTDQRNYLFERISKRVDKRIENNALKEVDTLIAKGVSWEAQSMNAIGYKQLRCSFEGKCSLQDAIAAWKRQEQKYALRQLAWFRRYKQLNWYDISQGGWQEKVENEVQSWYNSY